MTKMDDWTWFEYLVVRILTGLGDQARKLKHLEDQTF